MNIIFSNYDTLNNPYYAGGGAHAVHSTAKRLAKNHKVTVLCGSFPGSQDEIRDNVIYKRISFSVGSPKIDQLLYHFALPWKAVTEQFDVWIESFTPPFSTAFLPWFTNKPVVGVTHLLGGKGMSEKYHLPFRLVQSFGLRQYKYIIALSKYLAAEVKESGTSAKVTIIPNGLDSEIINRSFKKTEEHIFFLGRLDIFHKGLDVLIPAYKKISERTNFKLVIAGNGLKKEEEKVRQMIKDYNVEDKVVLVGRVHNQQKWELYEKSVFSVFPSRIEGFAIVALEAMASKSPMILSSIHGLRWVPDSASIKIPTFNPDDFADAMIELLNNPQKRQEMGEAGYATMKDYNWDAIAQKYEQLIAEVK